MFVYIDKPVAVKFIGNNGHSIQNSVDFEANIIGWNHKNIIKIIKVFYIFQKYKMNNKKLRFSITDYNHFFLFSHHNGKISRTLCSAFNQYHKNTIVSSPMVNFNYKETF